MEIEIKGHSGCQIEIFREHNDLFVYKSSRDRKYLERLVRQASKQQSAAKWEYQHIRVPEIFAIEQDAEHVSVKMEYVYSRNFIEYFESAGFEQIDYFIKALILFVEKELKESPVQQLPTAITMEKFMDVRQKVENNAFLSKDPAIIQILSESERIFQEFVKEDSIEVPLGICHGDLTFSNILFNGNNYYLIDFLDSFIESPLLDIVKIRQDSAHLWSQLMYTKNYDQLRLKIICKKIDSEIDGYFNKYDWYRRYYDIYQLMNLLRILQYAKEPQVVNYLKNSIRQVMSGKVNSVECPLRQTLTSPSEDFSLIVPAAADTTDDRMPYVFSLDENGIMLCIKAIQGLNVNVFTHLYFTILKKHAERYNIDEMMRLQFKRLGMNNAELVILDQPTCSQTETICQTILNCKIRGGIFIKDADGYFCAEVRRENSLSVFPLEEMSIVDPQHKSYVAVADMRYVTNIIEKQVVSNYFNVGGYGFENVDDFMSYYKWLRKSTDKVYASHVVYAMLLDKMKFSPIKTSHYHDWGNEELFMYQSMTKG